MRSRYGGADDAQHGTLADYENIALGELPRLLEFIARKNPRLRESYDKWGECLENAKKAMAQLALRAPPSGGRKGGNKKRQSIEANEDEDEEQDNEGGRGTRRRLAFDSLKGVLRTECKPKEGTR